MKKLNSFHLKIIAMITMAIDHLGHAGILGAWSRVIGRISMPLFAFLLVEGFSRSHNRLKYLLRLLLFACITEIPFNLFISGKFIDFSHQNILFTFSFSFILMLLIEVGSTKIERVLYSIAAIIFSFIPTLLNTDYGYSGVLTVLIFYWTKNMSLSWLWQTVFLITLYLTKNSLPFSFFGIPIPIQLFATLSIPIIHMYNGEKGYSNKFFQYFSYLFYPIHMGIIYIIKFLFF